MRTTLLSAVALALTACCNAQTNAPAITFQPLPYAYDALEPHLDAKTLEIHYSRHHKTYYTNLIKLLEETDLTGKTMEEILRTIGQHSAAIRTNVSARYNYGVIRSEGSIAAIRNNLGGHYNHTFFWNIMSPKGGGTPSGPLLEKINSTFGSFEAFKAAFKQAALKRFGSGWAWLCVAEDGSLFITSTANQDNPLMDVAEKRGAPILTIDVWEHAYYLKYQNLRASYVDAFWNVVNWPYVTTLFEQADKTNKTTPQQKQGEEP